MTETEGGHADAPADGQRARRMAAEDVGDILRFQQFWFDHPCSLLGSPIDMDGDLNRRATGHGTG